MAGPSVASPKPGATSDSLNTLPQGASTPNVIRLMNLNFLVLAQTFGLPVSGAGGAATSTTTTAGAQGVAGKQGPQGPQGVAGPAGPAGPQGPAGSFVANGSTTVGLGSVGPAGSHASPQVWLTISQSGTTRYIPCF